MELDNRDELLEAIYNIDFFNDDRDDDDSPLNDGMSLLASTGTITENFIAATTTSKPEEILTGLNDQSFRYAVLAEDPYDPGNNLIEGAVFASGERYSDDTFYSIMPDTGASGTSNAGLPQVKALMKMISSLRIEDNLGITIYFSAGSTSSIGIINIPMILGTITFQVLLTATPFLFSIINIDRMNIQLDNLVNLLIQGDLKILIIQRWGYL